MQIEQDKIKNILVVRNDRFGEFLLNIPALRALKENFPVASLIIIVDPKVKELAQNIPYVDKIISWGREKHTLFSRFKLFLKLLRIKADMAVILNPSKEFNLLSYLAGIPIRAGYDRKLGFLLTHRVKDKKASADKHEVEYNLELVAAVGAVTPDKRISLGLDLDLSEINLPRFSLADLGDFLVVHPFTSDQRKQWPLINFQELVRRLAEELAQKVIIVGGPDEAPANCQIFDYPNSSIINLVGETTLIQLAYILKKGRLLISGDSGPVHLASSVGTPVIAIFRNDLPGKTAKRWGPWGQGHIVIEKDSLSAILVEEVFQKTKEVLKR